jgi:BMFP domain-containing protein YqiC
MNARQMLALLIELRARVEALEAQVKKLQERQNGRPRKTPKTPVGD